MERIKTFKSDSVKIPPCVCGVIPEPWTRENSKGKMFTLCCPNPANCKSISHACGVTRKTLEEAIQAWRDLKPQELRKADIKARMWLMESK